MKRKLTTILCLFLSATSFSDSVLTGSVHDKESGDLVPFATVVMVELERIELTNEEGVFLFTEVPDGDFTLAFYVSGFEEKQESIHLPAKVPVLIYLEKILVEMEIILVEKRKNDDTTKSLDIEKIAKTPNGGDPFETIQRAGDTVKLSKGILERAFAYEGRKLDAVLKIPIFSYLNIFSYRSLPFAANSYYYDGYIPLYFSDYPDMILSLKQGILPADLVSAIELYGDGRNVSLGPGTGLISSAVVVDTIPEKPEVTISSSLLKATLWANIPLTSNSSLSLSLRKSLYEFTLLPLLLLIEKEVLPTIEDGLSIIERPFSRQYNQSFASIDEILQGNADLFARYIQEINPTVIFTLDLFNCTGYFRSLYEWVDYRPADITSYPHYKIDKELNIYQINGIGMKLDTVINDSLRNKLHIYDSLFLNVNNRSFSNVRDEVSTKLRSGEQMISMPLNEVGVRDTLHFLASDSADIIMGFHAKYISGLFAHTLAYNTSFFEEETLKGNYDTFEAAVFSKLSIEVASFTLSPSLRLDYFHQIRKVLISPVILIQWILNDNLSLVWNGAIRHGRFDYLMNTLFEANDGSIIDSMLPGDDLVIDEKYFMEEPPALYYTELEFIHQKESLSLKASGYFDYLTKISGFNFQTYFFGRNSLGFWDNTSEEIEGGATAGDTGFQSTDRMFATGFSTEVEKSWATTIALSAGYAFGYSQYHLKEKDRWIFPNSDVRHLIKTYFNFHFFNHFDLNVNLNIAFGIPQTPARVTSFHNNKYYYEPIIEKYNELRDWMPRFTVNFSMNYKWKTKKKWDVRIFADIINFISFPKYAGPKTLEIGFEESSWLDRSYDWSFGNSIILDPSVKLDFGFEISF